MPPKQLVRPSRRGLRVVGRDFYLWDADAREALHLAQDLSRRSLSQPLRRRRKPRD